MKFSSGKSKKHKQTQEELGFARGKLQNELKDERALKNAGKAELRRKPIFVGLWLLANLREQLRETKVAGILSACFKIYHERIIAKAISRSTLFDADWYLDSFPDVADAGIDPALHYVRYGATEGRDPGPNFSTKSYLSDHRDVAQNNINPLYHYYRFVKQEGHVNRLSTPKIEKIYNFELPDTPAKIVRFTPSTEQTEVVFDQFAGLFEKAANSQVANHIQKNPSSTRILFIANGELPTLHLSFVKPLRELVTAGEVDLQFLFADKFQKEIDDDAKIFETSTWFEKYLQSIDPDIVVFCRYSGPFAETMIDLLKRRKIPIIYHLDDNLLNIPLELGAKKYAFHNNPKRLASVETLLKKADVVYFSTNKLRTQLQSKVGIGRIRAGDIYCAASVRARPNQTPSRKIGYMGGLDHVDNFKVVLPALVTFLKSNPEFRFELFGSIPVPEELNQFGKRVSKFPRINNYEDFQKQFARLHWDIGLCPLVPSKFNLAKANSKWIEYTSIGAAVIASEGTVYDECCADGEGVLVRTNDDWLRALQYLTQQPEMRYNMAKQAQEKLESEYTMEILREQVLDIFETAQNIVADR